MYRFLEEGEKLGQLRLLAALVKILEENEQVFVLEQALFYTLYREIEKV